MAGIYLLKARQGALVREEASLTSAEVTTLASGIEVTVEEEALVDGKARVRLVAPARGWASKKLFSRRR